MIKGKQILFIHTMNHIHENKFDLKISFLGQFVLGEMGRVCL